MVLYFEVELEPRGKERPRFSKKSKAVYTPSKTVAFQNAVRAAFKEAAFQENWEKVPAGVPLKATIFAGFSIPKSASKKTKELMRNGFIYPTKKPDDDNIEKIVFDALNGIAYHDDAQIVYNITYKVYRDTPLIAVTLETL